MQSTLSFPLLNKNTLYHVGTLDPSLKSGYNYEGNCGLSVTTDPDAWRMINRGKTYGDLFTLSRPDAQFVDMFALDEAQEKSLIKWGVSQGLLLPATGYQFSYYDDELEQDVSWLYFTLEEAETESQGEHDIETVDSYQLSETLKQTVGELSYLTAITLIYVLRQTPYDGLYWESETDVLRYQAPRGIIFNTQLAHWHKTQQPCQPLLRRQY